MPTWWKLFPLYKDYFGSLHFGGSSACVPREQRWKTSICELNMDFRNHQRIGISNKGLGALYELISWTRY